MLNMQRQQHEPWTAKELFFKTIEVDVGNSSPLVGRESQTSRMHVEGSNSWAIGMIYM